jgi:hypothetical protein
VIPIGLALVLLGAWAVFAPLTGPYFGYGFDTHATWLASGRQWELDLGPGILVMVGGLVMLTPLRVPAWLAGLLAAIGGVWLLAGPSVYPLWGTAVSPFGSTHMRVLKWIGYFYGTGALITYLAAFAQGMLSRSVVVERAAPTVVRPTPVEEDIPVRRAS